MLQLAHSATPSLIISSVKTVLQVEQIFIGVRDFKSVDVNLPFISFSNVCVISGTTIWCDSRRVTSVRAEDFKIRSLLYVFKVKFEILKHLPPLILSAASL